MSGVTYESALGNLQMMFPSHDKATLEGIFKDQDYHVERTVEAILSMDSSNPRSRADEAAIIESDARLARELSGAGNFGPPEPRAAMSASGEPLRGVKIILPEDFLRAPGWKLKQVILADEQLAIMLQNEIFKEEARRAVGIRKESEVPITQQLAAMGTEAKKRLSALAHAFSRKPQYREVAQDEKKPLMAGGDDDDDEEVINFSDKPKKA